MNSKNTLLAIIALSALIITGCGSSSPIDTAIETPPSNSISTQEIEKVIEIEQEVEIENIVEIDEEEEIEVIELTSTIIYDGKEGVGRNGPAPDEIVVSITLNPDNTIASYSNIHNPTHRKSYQYGPKFENAVAGSVIGKTLDEVKFSKAGGASTTTEARNAAIQDIQEQISVNG